MRLAWIAFLGSVFLMVLGFSTVLIFMIFIVVPTLELDTVVRSECLIRNITYIPYKVTSANAKLDSSSKDYEEGKNTLDCDSVTGLCPRAAPHTMKNTTDSHSLRALCVFVYVEFRQKEEGRYKLGSLFDPSHLEVVTKDTSQCFCTNCKVGTDNKRQPISVSFQGHHLKIDQRKKCFYQVSKDPKVYPDGWILLNTMFWPTIVFIVGFIGTFFACILLAKEDWRCSKSDPITKD